MQTQIVLGAALVVALGGLGGIFYWCVIFPVDVVKSAMQCDNIIKEKRQYPTMASTAKVSRLHTEASCVQLSILATAAGCAT